MPGSKPANAQAVRTWSLLTAHGCLLLAALFVVTTVVHWLTATPRGLEVDLGLPQVVLSETARAIGLLLSLIPAALNAFALMRLRGSFRSFARGDLFTRTAILGLRDFAAGSAAAVVSAVLASPFISVALTIGALGDPEVDFNLSSTSLTILLISGVTWVFAHVLIRGAALAEENAVLTRENAAFV